MFRLSVRYVQLLHTNIEHAAPLQRTNAMSVHCDGGCESDMCTFCAAMTLQQHRVSLHAEQQNAHLHYGSYILCSTEVWYGCCGTVLSRRFELCTTSLTVTLSLLTQLDCVKLQRCSLCFCPLIDGQVTSLNQHYAYGIQAWH